MRTVQRTYVRGREFEERAVAPRRAVPRRAMRRRDKPRNYAPPVAKLDCLWQQFLRPPPRKKALARPSRYCERECNAPQSH